MVIFFSTAWEVCTNAHLPCATPRSNLYENCFGDKLGDITHQGTQVQIAPTCRGTWAARVAVEGRDEGWLVRATAQDRNENGTIIQKQAILTESEVTAR